MTQRLEDYILIVENALSADMCDFVISEYANSGDWVDAPINIDRHTEVNLKIRSCKLVEMSQSAVIEKNKTVRQTIDAALFESSELVLRTYLDKFPRCTVSEDSGYSLLRYEEGGFFSEHVDAFSNSGRAISCSFSLNDMFEGGEFSFFGGISKYTAPKGSAILFPSNFVYPHEILPVTKGTRYSVVTWFH